uniref:Uncharacterized protein AlNc14C1G147 n=1 Tax=Albugo laibachii Nc14 TaxID=890382 RepID=F0VZ00_9STRA|nr:conserved hypothetical protein [Albugo laibachii Nc14]|eukprot:CCA14015.1 conserved hypothetical protein [Albugo laibachii Nc14]
MHFLYLFTSITGPDMLRILTLNVYFDSIALTLRMRAIGKCVERLRPGVIGFQEVTSESLAILKKQAWSRYYDCSADCIAPSNNPYFVVLFTALPMLSIETYAFEETRMGRELICMHLRVSETQTLYVGTTHLESLKQNGKIRVKQLQECFTILKRHVDEQAAEKKARSSTSSKQSESRSRCLGAVLMGDTNLFREDAKYLDPNGYSPLVLEPARSNRALCRICNTKINKNELRVGKSHTEERSTREIIHWYHRHCFEERATDTEKINLEQLFQNTISNQEESKVTGKKRSMSSPPSEMIGIPTGWIDCWLCGNSNTEKNGFTFDGRINKLISNPSYQSRFDRMYFYQGASREGSGGTEMIERVEIIGKEPIAENLWMSDHFGLLSTFRFNLEDN